MSTLVESKREKKKEKLGEDILDFTQIAQISTQII